MGLVDAVRILRRRWYVLLPFLLITVLMTAAVDKSVPNKYQSTSTMTLLASKGSTRGTATAAGTGNPFLTFSPSLNETADFMVRRLDSGESGQLLLGLGVTDPYAAVLAPGAQGPFMILSVTGTNKARVLASMSVLDNFVATQLQAVQEQAGVPALDMITSMVIVPPSPPAAQRKTKTQDLLGAGIAGLVLTFLAVFAAESMAVSRRRRSRRPRRGSNPPPEPRTEQQSEPVPDSVSVEALSWFAGGEDPGASGKPPEFGATPESGGALETERIEARGQLSELRD